MLRVCLNCYGNYTTDSVYQWDLNQVLALTGDNINDVSAIHFCNKKCDNARVVNVTRDEGEISAPIPNELLEMPYDVIAYVHSINDNQAKTVEIINIPVIKRAKPDDYVFVENVDIVNFERLEKDITDYIAIMTSEYNAFTSTTNQNYNTFTSNANQTYETFTNTVTQNQNDFESEFMDEYNNRVASGYFLGPDGATNIQDRLTTLEEHIIDVDALNEATGSAIILTDSGENALTEIAIYGRSTQDGDPTPDNPIDIVSVGAGGTLNLKSTGKNVLPYPYYDGASKTVDGVTTTIDENGWAHIYGTTSTGIDCFNFTFRNVEFPPGTYIVSGVPEGASAETYRGWLGIYRSGTTTSLAKSQVYDEPITFTANEPFTMIYRATAGAGATFDVIYKPMVRRVEVIDDTYEPYKSSSISIPLTEPLRGIGDIRDELACKDGVYGVIRRIGTKVFDGSDDETWWKSNGNTSVDEYTLVFDNFKGTNSEMICTHFTYDRNSNAVGAFRNYHSTAWEHPYQVFVMFAEYGTSTETSLKEWLQANPVTMEYQLVEEVFEPFDDQEVFKNIVTYNNLTYLTNTDNADMWVQYYTNSNIGQRLVKVESTLDKPPVLATPMELTFGRLGPLSSLAVTALVPDIEGYTPLMSMYVRNTANGDKIKVTAYENSSIITNNRTKVILNNETDQIFDDVKAHIIILYVRK